MFNTGDLILVDCTKIFKSDLSSTHRIGPYMVYQSC